VVRTLWLLFVAFLRVGTFGYGGGPSMIPLVQHEVVEVHHWMNEDDFLDTLAMGNSLPGPIAIKMSAYIGYRVGIGNTGSWVGGALGAAAALLGTNLPAIVLMAVLSLIYLRIKDQPKVTAALKGARPAVIGLLIWTAYELGKPVILGSGQKGWAALVGSWDRLLLTVGAFVAATFFRVHPALVILGAAVIGFLIY